MGFRVLQSVEPIKMYRLEGEADSAIRWRKRTGVTYSR